MQEMFSPDEWYGGRPSAVGGQSLAVNHPHSKNHRQIKNLTNYCKAVLSAVFWTRNNLIQ